MSSPNAASRLAFTTLGAPAWSWTKVLDEAQRLGFGAIEVRGVDGEMDLPKAPVFAPAERAKTLADLEAHGLAICGLGSSVNLHDAKKLPDQLASGRAYIDLAQALGVPYVRVFGDKIPAGTDEGAIIAQVAAGLDELGRYAEGRGVGVLIEAHGDFSDSRRLTAVMARAHSPAVGILWDAHHPWRACGEPLQTTYAALKPWIRHIHVKDSRATADGNFRYCLTGEGEFPWDELWRILREDGYTGYISLEWEKRWHPELEEPEVALPQFVQRMRAWGF